jgi:hypothetical protein
VFQTSRNLLRSCQSFGLTDMKILSDRKIFCWSKKKAPLWFTDVRPVFLTKTYYLYVILNIHLLPWVISLIPLYFSDPAKPNFTRQLKDIFCKDGDNVTLECEVQGQPRPQITWYRDGKEILDSQVNINTV